MSTMERLNEVFRQVFDDDTLQIRPETTANDIDGWDSFAHMNLITYVESYFDIQLSDEEVPKLKNVGDMVALISKKIANLSKRDD